MDEHQPGGTPAQTSPVVPGQALSRVVLLLGTAVVLLLMAGVVWAYQQGYVSFSTRGPVTQSHMASTTVAWKTVNAGPALKKISFSQQYESQGYHYSYDFYDAGTITGGPLLGDELELGISSYTSPNDSGVIGGGYVYLVVNKSGASVGWWQDEDSVYPPELGLDTVPKLDKALFPTELLTYHAGDQTLTRPTADGQIKAQASIVYVTYNLKLEPVPGFTFEGDPILRAPAQGQTGIFAQIQPYNYYVQLPTGVLFSASLTPLFMSAESSVPNLTWSTGSTSVAAYNYDQYAYGLSDCFNSFNSFKQIQASFVQTGTTAQGVPVYEVNSVGNDSVYQCLYAKTQRYNYDSVSGESSSYYPTTYQDFLGTHPVFFWKNATGDWVIFGRTDVVPAAEKAKPVIYLYPPKTEQINVRVNPVGGFTKTEPKYGSGWNVKATPAGELTNLADGRTYPYLFWEGGATGVVQTPQEGFVVAQSDIPVLLTEKLSLLGLNKQERADFLSFWTPRLSQAPYYFITFIPRDEIDRVAPLDISPKPDTVIRILMDYKPLDKFMSVKALQITPQARKGFTAVEWGGIVR